MRCGLAIPKPFRESRALLSTYGGVVRMVILRPEWYVHVSARKEIRFLVLWYEHQPDNH